MGPKPGLPRKNSNKRAQTRESGLLRFNSAKCHNDHYAYKTKGCLELHAKFHHSQQGREKLKKEILKLYLRKKSTNTGADEETIPVWICTE